MTDDLAERLASWAEATPDSVTSLLLREASQEVERLRANQTGGDSRSVALTGEERVAIQFVIGDALSVDGVSIHATLRRLLERLGVTEPMPKEKRA